MLITCSLLLPAAWSQDAPKTELFAGYSYLNLDTQGLTKRLNLNGWEASGTFNFNNWFGVTGDVSGHYQTKCITISASTTLDCTHLSYMAGPTVSFRNQRTTMFVHGLAGGDRGKFGIGLATATDSGLAMAVGGGFDYAATDRISIRIGPLDYFMTRHGQDFGGTHQNNFRASTGVVFTFGRKRWLSNYDSNTAVPPSSESVSLGASGYQSDAGFTIASVRPGSRAESIYLKPGDVISTVDGKAVHSREDIDSVISASTLDTVKVTCILTTSVGKIASERIIKVR